MGGYFLIKCVHSVTLQRHGLWSETVRGSDLHKALSRQGMQEALFWPPLYGALFSLWDHCHSVVGLPWELGVPYSVRLLLPPPLISWVRSPREPWSVWSCLDCKEERSHWVPRTALWRQATHIEGEHSVPEQPLQRDSCVCTVAKVWWAKIRRKDRPHSSRQETTLADLILHERVVCSWASRSLHSHL